MDTTRMDKRKALLKRKEKGKRIYAAGIFFTLLLTLLIFRLYSIQILKGEEYVGRVRQQQIDQIELEKVSGNIIDRNGISFTSAGEILTLKVIPYSIGFNDRAYDVIESLTDKSKKEFLRNSSKIYSIPVVNMNADLIAAVEANDYPGVLCYKESIRVTRQASCQHVGPVC